MIYGSVKVNKTHLKSEPIIKFTAVIEPIEVIPATATVANAPRARMRKDVSDTKTVSNPVVKMYPPITQKTF